MTVAWTRAHIAALDDGVDGQQPPAFGTSDAAPAIPGLHLWDWWPIRHADGSVPTFGERKYWMALSASRSLQPSARHDVARLRLLSTDGSRWQDHGNVFPEGASPGSREWAGSAVYDPATRLVTVRYTASGHRGETSPSFVQRLYEASAGFDPGGSPPLRDWTDHDEMVAQHGVQYRSTLDQLDGEAGFIKAFRDPFVDTDPESGVQHLLFTASLADSETDFDAAVGHAVRADASVPWVLRPPVLHADGVNNEMERPHTVRWGSNTYLFFSTQARTFHPDVAGPTGLYGFVGESVDGEWRPLNGSGLVYRNPEAEPYQSYSWLVLNDLRVVSFVDMYALQGRHPDDVEAAGDMPEHFGGTIGPIERIELDGDRARLIARTKG